MHVCIILGKQLALFYVLVMKVSLDFLIHLFLLFLVGLSQLDGVVQLSLIFPIGMIRLHIFFFASLVRQCFFRKNLKPDLLFLVL